MSAQRRRYLIGFWVCVGLLLVLVALALAPGHAGAACARPVTENGVIRSAGRSVTQYGRFYTGIGTATNHQFAFWSWRSFRLGQRVVVTGCLDRRVIDVSRVY